MSLPRTSSTRRRFLKASACAACVAWVSGCSGESSSPRAPVSVPLGRTTDFPRGRTVRPVERLVIVHDERGFGAMSLRCTHQECLVSYGGDSSPTECPCHGSVFTPDGRVVQGPATLDLPWYEVRVSPDGVLEVVVGAVVPSDRRCPAPI